MTYTATHWVPCFFNGQPDGNMMGTNPKDSSGLHLTYPTGYDAKCSPCWLNIPHTNALHDERVNGRRA